MVQQVQWKARLTKLGAHLPPVVGLWPKEKCLMRTRRYNRQALIEGQGFFIFLIFARHQRLNGHHIVFHRWLITGGQSVAKAGCVRLWGIGQWWHMRPRDPRYSQQAKRPIAYIGNGKKLGYCWRNQPHIYLLLFILLTVRKNVDNGSIDAHKTKQGQKFAEKNK